MNNLLTKVRRTIENWKMLSVGERILVAVSGGPDSVALLHILITLIPEYQLSLHVAHLNHLFRGEEAKEDAVFVERLAKEFGLPITIEERDVPAFARKQRLSSQEAARYLRYQFLQNVAEKESVERVALGHHADDQVETILLNLMRGTSLAGLAGIPPVRKWQGQDKKSRCFIRPLIECFRSEIETFLSESGISARSDSSNFKLVYLRNKVRLELIPLLEQQYNPSLKNSLLRLVRILQEDERYLEQIAADNFPPVVEEKDEKICFGAEYFVNLPTAITSRIVRVIVREVKGDLKGISTSNIMDILALVRGGKTGSRLMLPGGVFVQKRYNHLVFSHRDFPFGIVPYHYELIVPGETCIREINCTLRSEVVAASETKLPLGGAEKERQAYLDRDKLCFPLIVRSRCPGDRFQPLGMQGTKKVKDFLIEKKVPREKRARIPLLVSGKDIVWIGGYEIAEKVKVTPETKNVLHISLSVE